MSRFLRICNQSSKKVLIWPIKNFFWKNRKRCQKTQNFTLISNPLKNLLKNVPKKSYKQNKFDEHELVIKVHISVKFFLITFFCAFFQNFFNGFQISVKFCIYFIHILNFWPKNFFSLFSTFVNFVCKCAGNSSKKRKIFFYECVLEFNYAYIKGFA